MCVCVACVLLWWYTRPKTVTHPGTNQARRALTSFVRRTPLTTMPRHQLCTAVMCSYWRRSADCRTPTVMDPRWRRRDACSAAAAWRGSSRERNARRWRWRPSGANASWHRWRACSAISSRRTENCLTPHPVTRSLPAQGETVLNFWAQLCRFFGIIDDISAVIDILVVELCLL